MKVQTLIFPFLILYAVGLWNARSQFAQNYFSESRGEMTGEIEEINYDDYTILLRRYVDGTESAYDQEYFRVLKDAVIRRAGEILQFSDLVWGQEVTLRYRMSPDGTREVQNIWVVDTGG